MSRFILQTFRRWSRAEIEIARQSGRSGEMRFARPQIMIAHRVAVRRLEPRAIFLSRFLLRVVHIQNHRRQKWRLRSRQVIRAIRIQHRAVVLDLKEKILHHPLRQLDAFVAQQSANDEVAVPPIHLVESSARHDVLVRQIQKPRGIDFVRIDFAEIVNHDRQMLGFDFAFRLKLLHRGRHVKIGRHVKHRRRRQLRINDRFAFVERARQRVPTLRDVLANRFESGLS